MVIREDQMKMLLEIGVALSAEKDYNRLLEQILTDVMTLTSSDAGTLYLKEGDFLSFKIMRNDTFQIYQGGNRGKVDLPPVPISKHNVCSLALLLNKSINIEDVRECKEYDLSGPMRYDALTGYRTQSMLVVPMSGHDGEVLGVMQLLNAKDQDNKVIPFAPFMERLLESVAGQAAVALENMRYMEEIKALFYSFVQVMSSAIDQRTPYNAAHTRNMVRYGTSFLDFLEAKHESGESVISFSARQREELLMSVWLHDIGKLVTPLDVMNKADRLGGRISSVTRRLDVIMLQARVAGLMGETTMEEAEGIQKDALKAVCLITEANTAGFLNDETVADIKALGNRYFTDTDGVKKTWLTEEEVECLTIRKGTLTSGERRIMESHVEITEKLLSEIRFSKDYEHVTFWAGSHHEYLNGTGYPRHLKGDEIPAEVRVITILDIFDALTASDRPYKPGMPPERAVKILEEMAQKEGKLDQELTLLFIESRCWEK